MSEALTNDGLSRFDEVAHRHVDDLGVPGLVALVGRGDDVHVATAGSLSIGGPPVERDSLFRIASMTKPITAAATMALVAEGSLTLDEPVTRLLPELADRRVLRRIDGPLDDTVAEERFITARDLLTFTFGFGTASEMFEAEGDWPIMVAEGELGLCTLGPPQPQMQPSPDEWMKRLGSLPLLAQPGERWFYNTGASVLGVLSARAAGRPFDEVLSSRIFEPLEMTDTAMWTSDSDRLGTTYAPAPDGLRVWDPPDGAWSRRPEFGDGAAGLLSTVDDLHLFARMFLRAGAPVLSRAAVAEMTRDHLTESQRVRDTGPLLFGKGWGFCQAVGRTGHHRGTFGWNGGLGSSWLVDPVRDMAVIVLTARMFESPALPEVHADLQDAAYVAAGVAPIDD